VAEQNRFQYFVDGAGFVLFCFYVAGYFAIFSDTHTVREFLILVGLALGLGTYAGVIWYFTRRWRDPVESTSAGKEWKFRRIRFALSSGALLLTVLELAALINSSPITLMLSIAALGMLILLSIYACWHLYQREFKNLGWRW